MLTTTVGILLLVFAAISFMATFEMSNEDLNILMAARIVNATIIFYVISNMCGGHL